MLRRFTKDFGRYIKGDVRDYPAPTWRALAGKASLDSFSEVLDLPPEVLISATRRGGGLAHPLKAKEATR